jgi:exodeoxyribonuclease X
MLDKPGICTYRCAKQLWPEAPSFSNQTLRYHLKLFKEPAPKAMPPHRAAADVWVTAHILLKMLRERSVKELLELTKAPILLRTVHFGKYRGEEWSKVPKPYLHWILKQDFDRDVVHTARYHV